MLDSLVTRRRTFDVAAADKKLRDYVRGKQPNKCVINPPYENDNPINFTMSAIEYLDEGGRLVIIMPNNTLSKYANEKAARAIFELRDGERRLYGDEPGPRLGHSRNSSTSPMSALAAALSGRSLGVATDRGQSRSAPVTAFTCTS